MNIEKLTDELAKASAAKADAELDRMIKLHQDQYTAHVNGVKLYLQQVGTVHGKATDYAHDSATMITLLKHRQAVQFLQELKEELK